MSSPRNIGASDEEMAALHKAVTSMISDALAGKAEWSDTQKAAIKEAQALLKQSDIQSSLPEFKGATLSINESLPFPDEDEVAEG